MREPTGMICGLANAFPELLKKMYDAYKSGDRSAAMEMQRIILDVRALTKTAPTVPILHEILRMKGIDAGYSRSPLIEISDAAKQKIRSSLKTLNLL